MKPTEPVDIMVGCCLPDRKRLLEALSAVPPGDTIQVRIENSAAVKVMIEKFIKSKRSRIVQTRDEDDTSVLTIKKKK
jgi:TusA-related sulfurtransferase